MSPKGRTLLVPEKPGGSWCILQQFVMRGQDVLKATWEPSPHRLTGRSLQCCLHRCCLLLFHCRVSRQQSHHNGPDQLFCAQTEALVLSFDGLNQKHSFLYCLLFQPLEKGGYAPVPYHVHMYVYIV